MNISLFFYSIILGFFILSCSKNKNEKSETNNPKTYSNEKNPKDILKKTLLKYESLNTYQSEGKVVSKMISGGYKINSATEFSIKLKKIDQFLIKWANIKDGVKEKNSAVWKQGKDVYLFDGVSKEYSIEESSMMALAGAGGISNSASFIIPVLFLTLKEKRANPNFGLKEIKLEKIEKIGEVDCYVISGSSNISLKETYWISKDNFLIKKYKRLYNMEPKNMPELLIHEEGIKAFLKSTGKEINEKNIKEARSNLEEVLKKQGPLTIGGFMEQTYEKISSPKLSDEDFKFPLPVGAKLIPSEK